MRRISVSAVRPTCSTFRSASPSSDAAGIRCRTAPTWSTITLTACATTSCSSRAIRARSSATASRAADSRSRSARSARSSAASVCRLRSRRASPTSQPMVKRTGVKKKSPRPVRRVVVDHEWPSPRVRAPARPATRARSSGYPTAPRRPCRQTKTPAWLTIRPPSTKLNAGHTTQRRRRSQERELPPGT